MTIKQCKTCLGKIIWAKTIHDKMVPIDATPVEDGNIELVETSAGAPIAHVRSGNVLRQMNVTRYRSHFASCRDAQLHRSPR